MFCGEWLHIFMDFCVPQQSEAWRLVQLVWEKVRRLGNLTHGRDSVRRDYVVVIVRSDQ